MQLAVDIAGYADGRHEVTLGNGVLVRFDLSAVGSPRIENAIRFSDFEKSEILTPSIRKKIQRVAEEGVCKQLYSPILPDTVERTILAMRWELPTYEMLSRCYP